VKTEPEIGHNVPGNRLSGLCARESLRPGNANLRIPRRTAQLHKVLPGFLEIKQTGSPISSAEPPEREPITQSLIQGLDNRVDPAGYQSTGPSPIVGNGESVLAGRSAGNAEFDSFRFSQYLVQARSKPT
jgi:hypothetical protein